MSVAHDAQPSPGAHAGRLSHQQDISGDLRELVKLVMEDRSVVCHRAAFIDAPNRAARPPVRIATLAIPGPCYL
jgi:hypothetical protein